VPVLLSGAFHVHQDLPAQLGDLLPTRIAAHLGPDQRVLAAVASQLPHDAESVVLCATGSSDVRVHEEVAIAARRLEERIARPVRAAYLSAAEPTLEQAAAGLVAPVVAPYLLAEGRFSTQLAQRAEALGLRHSAVIGAHAELVALIAERFRSLLG
jgi:sirohydrochlorin ferrochelatase